MRLPTWGWHCVAIRSGPGPGAFVLCHLFNQVLIHTRTHGSLTANMAFGLAIPHDYPNDLSTPKLTVHTQSEVCLLVSFIGLHGYLGDTVLQYYSVQRRDFLSASSWQFKP